MALSSLTKNQL